MKQLMISIWACALALPLAVSGCYTGTNTTSVKASNNYVTEKVSLSAIDAIHSHSSVDVVYTQTSGTPYAEIYAPDNILPLVEVEQKGSQLSIGYKSNSSIRGKFKCEVRVFAPEVTSFSTSSSSDILLANELKTEKDVTCKASSSGDIQGESIACANLKISSSSSGDIKINRIEGKAISLLTESSGDISISEAICEQTDIEARSSGDCAIRQLACIGAVSASCSSSGEIILSGTCQNAAFDVSSSGGIYAKDLQAKDIQARASSAGDIECNASGVLSTDVSSAGSIRYKGEPAQVEGKIKGVSKL